MIAQPSPDSLDDALTRGAPPPPPLSSHRLVRCGAYAWALIGIGMLALALAVVLLHLAVLVVPLVLALFPAAVLSPLTLRLTRQGLPRSLAALVVLFGSVMLLAGVFSFIVPQAQAQLGDVGKSLGKGYAQVEAFLARGPFGLQPIRLNQLLAGAQARLGQGAGGLAARALGLVDVVVEGLAVLVFFLFALFFYLKDGAKIAAWLRSLFPQPAQADAEHIGGLVWRTIGGYIRGQLIIALVDATLIGVGLLVLRVPLALPLTLFVFFGALFPIIGAIVAGALALLVALATGGSTSALLVLVLLIVVFQLEAHVLSPLVQGRAVQLHPLAVVAALTAGGVLLGVLGAFLAIPVTASAARAVAYLRHRER